MAFSNLPGPARYASYAAFFPYYLREHQHPTCRRLHFIGTGMELLCFVAVLVTRDPRWLLGAALAGYGFAWSGHAFFEHNRPATFRYPLWSYIADHHMLWLAIRGRLAGALSAAMGADR